MAIIDINPGNIPNTNATLKKPFFALNLSLDNAKLIDNTKIVLIKHEQIATIVVFKNHFQTETLYQKTILNNLQM